MIDAPKIRSISITPARGGYVVQVGCQVFVFTRVESESLINELREYLNNPERLEKEYAGSDAGYAVATGIGGSVASCPPEATYRGGGL